MSSSKKESNERWIPMRTPEGEAAQSGPVSWQRLFPLADKIEINPQAVAEWARKDFSPRPIHITSVRKQSSQSAVPSHGLSDTLTLSLSLAPAEKRPQGKQKLSDGTVTIHLPAEDYSEAAQGNVSKYVEQLNQGLTNQLKARSMESLEEYGREFEQEVDSEYVQGLFLILLTMIELLRQNSNSPSAVGYFVVCEIFILSMSTTWGAMKTKNFVSKATFAQREGYNETYLRKSELWLFASCILPMISIEAEVLKRKIQLRRGQYFRPRS